MTRSGLVLAAGAVLALAGCGGGPPAGPPIGKAIPVAGTVKLADGTVVKGGVISFTPVEPQAPGGKLRYEGSSLIDAKGQYKAGLNGDGAGLVPGEYKVVVSTRELGELKDSNISRVPKAFTSRDTTTLKVTVDESTSNLDIVLK